MAKDRDEYDSALLTALSDGAPVGIERMAELRNVLISGEGQVSGFEVETVNQISASLLVAFGSTDLSAKRNFSETARHVWAVRILTRRQLQAPHLGASSAHVHVNRKFQTHTPGNCMG